MTDYESEKRLSQMALVLTAVKAKIASLSAELEKNQKIQDKLEIEDIPELMLELEMKKFTLTDGTEFELLDDLKCGITEANRPEAHKWLRKMKLGGVIRTLLNQNYGPEEAAEALKNAERISELTGRPVALTESVHPGTLKALLKEQRKKGTKIPEKLFGLFPFSRAKVTPPKG